jgi:hypothetical protein
MPKDTPERSFRAESLNPLKTGCHPGIIRVLVRLQRTLAFSPRFSEGLFLVPFGYTLSLKF